MVSKERKFNFLQFGMLFEYTCTLYWIDNLIKPVLLKKKRLPITNHGRKLLLTSNNLFTNNSNKTSPVASHLKLLMEKMNTFKKDNTSILTRDECKRLAIQKLINDLNTRTAEQNSSGERVESIQTEETDKSTSSE